MAAYNDGTSALTQLASTSLAPTVTEQGLPMGGAVYAQGVFVARVRGAQGPTARAYAELARWFNVCGYSAPELFDGGSKWEASVTGTPYAGWVARGGSLSELNQRLLAVAPGAAFSVALRTVTVLGRAVPGQTALCNATATSARVTQSYERAAYAVVDGAGGVVDTVTDLGSGAANITRSLAAGVRAAGDASAMAPTLTGILMWAGIGALVFFGFRSGTLGFRPIKLN